MKHHLLCSILWVANLFGLGVAPAGAATFNIPNGDVAALKAAILAANSNNDYDTIHLAAGGLYVLIDVDNSINGDNGLPVVENDQFFPGVDLTINGNGARIERQESAPFCRILQVAFGATCVINDLGFSNGRVLDLTGTQGGGALYNNASRVVLNGCTFDNNRAIGAVGANGVSPATGGTGSGGAICHSGLMLTVNNCAFINNQAIGGRGGNSIDLQPPFNRGGNGGLGRGGAIFSSDDALDLNGCTFHGNTGAGGAGGAGTGGTGTSGSFVGGALDISGGRIFGCTFNLNSGRAGAGVYVRDGSPTFSGCTWLNNVAENNGGALYNAGATLLLSCNVNNNRAELEGGGILNAGALTIEGSVFESNRTITGTQFGENLGGGAIAQSARQVALLEISNTRFIGNQTAANGGAIHSYVDLSGATSTVRVAGCTFENNTHTSLGSRGGAIHHRGGTGGASALEVTSSTFTGNRNLGGGGAIYHWSAGGNSTLTARNNTFSGNGGGIVNFGTFSGAANATLLCNTFHGNNGGALFNSANGGGTTAVSLGNNVFKSATGANLANNGGTITSQGYNLSNDDGGGFLNGPGDQINIDPQLGPLQDNGGPTFTHAPLAGSPVLDQGHRFGIATDQRGAPRPLDDTNLPNASGGDGSDIGAVEADIAQTGPQFVVTTLDDHDDGSASVLDCTLREALNAANAAADANSVVFAPGLTGVVALAPALGRLTVSNSVTITGPGARVLAVQGNAAGAFAFTGGTSVFAGLTVRGGAVGTFSGAAEGGGILNQATLTVTDCAIADNSVAGGEGTAGAGVNSGGPGGAGSGGGVANVGAASSLTLRRCTFSRNSATGGLGGEALRFGSGGRGGDGRGGAVFNAAGCTLVVENCTFHGNIATGGGGGGSALGSGGAGGDGLGSAVFNLGTMTLTSGTVSANTGLGGAGGGSGVEGGEGPPGNGGGALFSAAGSSSTVRNAISSGNGFAGDVGGAFASGGYNLISDPSGSTGFTATGDQTFADPRLGPLRNNGGPTDTMAPRADSQALDRGHSFGVTNDQRGIARLANARHRPDAPGGDGADVGAVEINPFAPSADADQDGLPDEWEVFYAVDDPAADPDNDGATNLDEYGASTDPRDNGSFVLRIISITHSGADVVITFNGVASRTFRLEQKTALTDPDWLGLPGTPDLTTPQNGEAQFIHAGGLSASQRFYRVRLLP